MCFKRISLFSVLTFVFVFLFDFLVHGNLLEGMYQQTAHVWRSEAAMEELFPVMLASQVLFSIAVVLFFACMKKCAGEQSMGGTCFGISLGLVIAAMQLSTYSYMPIPLALTGAWMLAGFLKATGIGFILKFF